MIFIRRKADLEVNKSEPLPLHRGNGLLIPDNEQYMLVNCGKGSYQRVHIRFAGKIL